MGGDNSVSEDDSVGGDNSVCEDDSVGGQEWMGGS